MEDINNSLIFLIWKESKGVLESVSRGPNVSAAMRTKDNTVDADSALGQEI